MLRNDVGNGDFLIEELSGIFRLAVDVDWQNPRRHWIGINKPDWTDGQMQRRYRKTQSSNPAGQGHRVLSWVVLR